MHRYASNGLTVEAKVWVVKNSSRGTLEIAIAAPRASYPLSHTSIRSSNVDGQT